MLVEISIRNFAIIPSLNVSFQQGLNVLTGETGAGKSIIMDAVSLLIGGRASIDYIRHGEKKAEIEGLFMLEANHPALALLQELGIEIDENNIILRRDLSVQGKSVCRINGKLVTLATLREIGHQLVDIHGQHEHQQLLHDEKHLFLLDQYGEEQIQQHRGEYAQLYSKYKKLNQQLRHLTEGEQQLVQRLDLLKYQLQEISKANLEPGEDEKLAQEKLVKSNAQKLFKGVEEAYQYLYGDGKALDALSMVMNSLQELAHIDQELSPAAVTVESIYYQLEDISHSLSGYKNRIEFEPERLHQIEERLMEIEQLKRKYGKDISDILIYASKIEEELDNIEHKDDKILELKKQLHETGLDLVLEAKNLTRIRTQVAKRLEQEIMNELKDLYMDKAQIQIQIAPVTSGEKIEDEGVTRWLKEDGWDEVQFLLSSNPGEPLKPLSKIASGGELSRLMLALKTVLSKMESVTTLIFDEVDTGVSGRVAQAMAEKLYAISCDQQVLCISHHPQVAALADEHYYIKKEMTDKETITQVFSLNQEERVLELARMMSGAEVTETTRSHAQELLHAADGIKVALQGKLSK